MQRRFNRWSKNVGCSCRRLGFRGRLPSVGGAGRTLRVREGRVAGVVLPYGSLAHVGVRHYSGTHWSATQRDHVIYESRLELANLLLVDSDSTAHHRVTQQCSLHAEGTASSAGTSRTIHGTSTMVPLSSALPPRHSRSFPTEQTGWIRPITATPDGSTSGVVVGRALLQGFAG
jgi:hypothetical protein